MDPGVTLPAGASPAERFAAGRPQERDTSSWSEADFRGRAHDWAWWARAEQRAPDSDWRTWLILAGRGFGKTRAGAEWVRTLAEADGSLRIALVAATMAEARAVMVEGTSGLLAIAPEGCRPRYESSLRRVTWSNGAQAMLFSAAEPDSLRGAQHNLAWADEVGKWQHGIEAWDNLAMGLRLGERPRAVATTTPRPTALVRRMMSEPGVVVTGGRTQDNRANLASSYVAAMQDSYGGTRIGRQELDGEMIEDVSGALWSRALIECCRRPAPDVLRRVVIGVDPPAGAGAGSDACGIVVAALGPDEAAYVLEDASIQGASPERWAQAVASAAARWRADRVIAEANNGGAMVESVLRAADQGLPVRLVHASHGKSARAEPVAALYEAGRAFHTGCFPQLEDELAGLIAGGGYQGPGRSPDRADALVWAMHALMLGHKAAPGVRRI